MRSLTQPSGCDPLAVDAEQGVAPAEKHPSTASLAGRPVLAIAAAVGLVLLLTSGRVGYFNDELYFLVAGNHLDWGYADQGPLLPLLARAMDTVFPGSLVGQRLPATVLTAVGVVVAALITRELGGRHRAQVLTAGTYAMATMAGGHLLTTATVDVFLWTMTTWLLVRWVRLRDDRLLLWLGVVTAIALQNKWLIVTFWVVVAISVLAVGPRELLRRPLLWLGAVLVVLVVLPNLLWQAHYGWPYLAFTQVVAQDSLFGGRLAFLPLVLVTAGVGVGTALLCYGLWRLLRSPELRSYRFLGWTFVGLVGFFLVTGGRFYYLAGLVALLLAAGAVELQRREPARWWRWVFTPPVYLLSAIIALTALPVLPVSWPTPARPVSLASLGWPELADTVAGAYRALPPATRRTTALVTDSYWDASALDRYGPARGLPQPFSPHRGYWYFGAPADDVDTVLFVGSDPTYLRRYFTEVRQVTTVTTGPAMNLFSLATPVWLCSGQRAPWSQLWPQLRHL
ncbi:MAG: ArnT family glycosyltransferase [Pseudonocardiaceae bacterium]